MALASDYVKEKRKETVLEKYGVDNVGKCEVIKEKRKETCLKKYGVEYTTQLQSTIDKIHESKTKHKTHTCSKEEDKVYELLKTMYNDIRRQYKSEDYPFACDFYIADNDLYIECNFHWTHGNHPFNKYSIVDMIKLSRLKLKARESKYHEIAIDVWTRRDVEKLNYLKHLNHLIFYSLSEMKDYFNNRRIDCES